VRIPSLSASVDTVVYVYYGNAAAADQQNKTGVWDSNYKVVNHLKDASGPLTDSTQYGNHGAASGGAAFTASGLAGGAYSFDGSSGSMTIPYSSTWNGSFSNYTVQLWIKLGTPQDYRAALAVGGWGSPFNIWFYANGSMTLRMDTANGFCQVGGAVPLDNAFHQLALTYDAGLGKLNAYIDGVGSAYPASCSGPIAIPAANLTLGAFANQLYLQSTLDELRISANVTRTAGWIVTEYKNQKSPSTFYSLGASETTGATAQ
jgi:Concanavalin A-like lectin/glucanases superfamily